jgi:hypothetical protein
MEVERMDGPRSAHVYGPLHAFRCAGCSYGASRSIAPERCPMCGSSVWELDPWRPFAAMVIDLTSRRQSANGRGGPPDAA